MDLRHYDDPFPYITVDNLLTDERISEIEALAHLASLPIFLLIIAELKNLTKFNTKNLSYVIYFSVLNASLFLIYPEIFLISASILFILLLIEFKNKKFKNLILFK